LFDQSLLYQAYDRDHEGEVHHGPCAFNASETSDKSNLAQSKASNPYEQCTIECTLLYLAREQQCGPGRRNFQLHQQLLLPGQATHAIYCFTAWNSTAYNHCNFNQI
jgi:hypothetical protein